MLAWPGVAVLAQNVGVNRASLRWNQINNEASRVIFPDGQDSLAQRVAAISAALAKNHSATIGPYLQKIDIIIQSENTLSNAYVGLGPYRSEMYMTPPQNPFYLGSNGWADQLTIHEFRHVQQFSNFNVGLTRLGGVLGGQYGRAIANNMSIPDWFWEGDAIWNETIHTQQGRGRLPYFFNAYKSLYKANKQYSWMKLRNGSLKHYIPNHYDMGYLLVGYGREQYGDTVWRDVTQQAAAFKGLFYPMQKAVARTMGVPFKQFTSEAFDFFNRQWEAEQSPDPVWHTGIQKRNVIDYSYPYPVADGSMIALKRTFRQIPRFVQIDSSGREKKLAVRDIDYEEYFGYNNGKLIYTAYQPDPRWANREYSVIMLLDLAAGTRRRVTTRSRYFSPDIAHHREDIVAVEVLPGQPSALHILDSSGTVTHQLTAHQNLFFSHPKWLSNDREVVVAARQPDGQMGWLRWQVGDSNWQWLLPPAQRLLGFPVVQGDTLVYSYSANGMDGLQALQISTGQVLLTKPYETGIYQGFWRQGQLTGTTFTADGFRIGSWDAAAHIGQQHGQNTLKDLYVPQTLSRGIDLSRIEVDSLPSRRYKKSFRLVNLHSWIPEPNEPDYRFTFIGENVLSTLSSELFYNYNVNETSHGVGGRILFGDSYIMPFVNASQTWGRSIKLNADTTLTMNETEAGLGLLLPLNLTGGKYARRLNFTTAVNFEMQRWQGLAKQLIPNRNYLSSVSRMVYVAQIQRALQHIYPRFGQTLIVDYRRLLANGQANQFLASGALYLPGAMKTHSLVLTGAYQARDTLLQYLFPNSFPFSRGYNSLNFPRMWRFGVNYHFPIAYPDAGFANILYLKRLRANLFYDLTRGKSLRTGRITPFNTTGAELFFDMRAWNVQPFTFGLRYSYLLNTDLQQPGKVGLFEFILPINLFGS